MKLSISITKDPNEYFVSDYVLREAAGMPLISVNIKDSGGLASHSNAVTAAIERSLKNSTYADLIFVARYISLGNTMTAYHTDLLSRNGTVHCHQAVLESLSPTLRGMFQVLGLAKH